MDAGQQVDHPQRGDAGLRPAAPAYRRHGGGNASREPVRQVRSAVSPDGRTIAFTESGTGADKLLLAPITGGAPTVVDARPATQRSADFSADGRWLAYDEVGANGNSESMSAPSTGMAGGTRCRTTAAIRRAGRAVGRRSHRKGDAVFAASFDAAKGEAGVPSVLFRKHDLRPPAKLARVATMCRPTVHGF